ncbi:peptidoglycan DD-metalloendopeptidase family protein, partial [Tamlana crocina]
LKDLEVGQIVKQGEQIAALGNPSENGNYAPHLHFQIIYDMEGKEGDYPGVASKREIGRYLQNCPDPDLLVKIG